MNASPAQSDARVTGGLVSVVIPTYNRAALLCRAIESALAQTYANLQVIVADDGSTDGTERIVNERFRGDPRVEYVRKENSGVSATRNFALTFVRGDYVAFLDSDDEWQPWKLELQLAIFQRLPNVGMIWTNMDAVDDSGHVTAAHCIRDSYACYQLFTNDELFGASAPVTDFVAEPPAFGRDVRVYWGDAFHGMALGNLCQPSSVIVTRERADRIGGFNEEMKIGEDHEYHVRATRAGDAALLDVAAIRYRRGSADQLTRPDLQIHIARNYLRTIRAVLDSPADRNRVNQRLLRSRVASAHAWIADEALAHGSQAQARENYFASLRVRPGQAKVALKLAVCLLPASIVRRILESRSA